MTEEWKEAKRALGNGRWDRVLKTKMVELSKDHFLIKLDKSQG